MYTSDSGDVTLTDCRFTANQASDGGGGIRGHQPTREAVALVALSSMCTDDADPVAFQRPVTEVDHVSVMLVLGMSVDLLAADVREDDLLISGVFLD